MGIYILKDDRAKHTLINGKCTKTIYATVK